MEETTPGSEWILCNSCFRSPRNRSCSYLFKCSHIFCLDCIRLQPSNNLKLKNIESDGSVGWQYAMCKICQKEVQMCKISKKMDPSVLHLFDRPKNLMNSAIKEIRAIIRFQNIQCNSFLKHCFQMRRDNEKLRQYCLKLRERNAELERQAIQAKAKCKSSPETKQNTLPEEQ